MIFKFRHHGPGIHKSGTPQSVHGKGGMAKWKSSQEDEKRKATESDSFPSDWHEVRRVKYLGGSTGAVLAETPDGRQFVQKTGANAGHITEECYTDSVYRALGINVPDYRLYDAGSSSPVKLSKFIPDGESLDDVFSRNAQRYENATDQLRQNFAADALLGNWDVVGLGRDNVLVATDGTAWRIDNGGALRYRAQGAKKKEFGEWPTEIWTMRDASRSLAGEIFSRLSMKQVAAQIPAIQAKRAAVMSALPPELHQVVGARIDNMSKIADLHSALVKAGRSEQQAESMVKGFVEKAASGGKFPTLEEAMKSRAWRVMTFKLRHGGPGIHDIGSPQSAHLGVRFVKSNPTQVSVKAGTMKMAMSQEEADAMALRQTEFGTYWDDLSRQQRGALYEYGAEGYERINDYLRQVPGRALNMVNSRPDVKESIDKNIARLDGALTHELSHDTQLWRGMDSTVMAQMKVGAIITDPGYGSTSVLRRVGISFADFGNGVLCRITARKGTKCGTTNNPQMMYDSEQEILIARGQKYRVAAIGKLKSMTVVHLETV